MKRLIAIAAASALAFALAGCASGASSSASSEASSSASSESSMAVSDISESSSSAEQVVETIDWTKAKTADEAAQGAGFEKFGVMDEITLDDIDFKDPSFAYAGGVAQACYEQGAAMLDVRKADGKHDTPLTDRDKTEFANKWSKSYEGLDVTLYGVAKGAATVIEWSDGTKDYGVTIQGLGGEELSIDSDEVAAVVKAIKEADGEKKEESKETEEPKSEESKQAEEQSSGDPRPEGDPGLDFNQLVWDNGLGQYEYTGEVFQAQDGAWYWPVFSRGADGKLYAHYFDTQGNLAWSDEEPIDNGPQEQAQDQDEDQTQGNKDGVARMTEADIQDLIWSEGLGEYVSAEFQPSDGDTVDAWRVIVHNTNGEEVVVFFNDEDGTYAIY